MKELLIYIVSYQRKSYTEGTLEALYKNLPKDADIIVCDNGSTDGTREYLEEQRILGKIGTIFPDDNLRVGGAWTMLTKILPRNAYKHIILLDNDGWLVPDDSNWYEDTKKLLEEHNIASIGLQRERRPGYFSMEKTFDYNYNSKKPFADREIYSTVFFAAFRLDKYDLWWDTMYNWPHRFIGEKLCSHYRSIGYDTVKITPGYVIDASEYNFNNEDHLEYNKEFYEKERDQEEFERRMKMHSTKETDREFIKNVFGKEYLKYLGHD